MQKMWDILNNQNDPVTREINFTVVLAYEVLVTHKIIKPCCSLTLHIS